MNRSKFLSIYLFLIALIILSSCSPVNFKPLFKSRSDILTDTLKTLKAINTDPAATPAYRIQVGDVLDIHNTTKDKIENGSNAGVSSGGISPGSSLQGFRVEEDGAVFLPKLDGKAAGKVNVLGLTRREATDKIQKLYAAGLFVDPLIDVSVVSQKVIFLGEFKSEGTYYLDKENVSLIEILGLAGGFTPRADPQTLKIVRGGTGAPDLETIYVNLQDLNTLKSPKIILQNKDVVYVEPNRQFIKYDKSQSTLGVYQTVLALITTGLLVYTSFIK